MTFESQIQNFRSRGGLHSTRRFEIRLLFQKEVYGSDSPATGTPGAAISSKFEISWDSIVSFRQFGLLFLFCSLSESESYHDLAAQQRRIIGMPNDNLHLHCPLFVGDMYKTSKSYERHNATHIAKITMKCTLFRSAQLQLYIHREGGLELQLDDNVSSKKLMRVSRPSQGCLHPAPLPIAA